MTRLMLISSLLVFAACQTQITEEPLATTDLEAVRLGPEIVDFCDLVRDPAKYRDKLISIRAVYRHGFEYSELYSLRCVEHPVTTVELESVLRQPGEEIAKCSTDARVYREPYELMGAHTLGIEATGKLIPSDRPAGGIHFGYKFALECYERVEFIDGKGNGPWALTPEMRRKIEVFERHP